jgi:SAM-dependent methyltransferase
MADFYVDTLRKLLDRGILARDSSILSVCGSFRDRDCLVEAGLRQATISNLDERITGNEFAPYQWSRQDAEQLDFADESFDFCIAHNGLHHCRSPHRALLDMYRVARKGVLVFEPLDNLITRLGARLGLGQRYEIAAVAGSGYACGGLRNTVVPNYVYRWTPREIEKAIHSYAPFSEHQIAYFYQFRFPWEASGLARRRLRRLIYFALVPLTRLVTWIYPPASNNFAFLVLKPRIPEQLHPWLKHEDGQITLRKEWVEQRYRAGDAHPHA